MKSITQNWQLHGRFLVKVSITLLVLAGFSNSVMAETSGLTLTHKNMKALIGQIADFQTNNRIVSFNTAYFDSNGVVEFYQFDINYDLTYDTQKFRNDVEIKVLARSTAQSYGLTKDDLIWVVPNLIEKSVLAVQEGIWSVVVDGKTAGNTNIFTNTFGRDFLVTDIKVFGDTVAGLGTPPVINIGTNASSYDNIVSGKAMSIMNVSARYSDIKPDNNAALVSDGDILKVRVATAAILTTTYDFKVIIKGIYVPA